MKIFYSLSLLKKIILMSLLIYTLGNSIFIDNQIGLISLLFLGLYYLYFTKEKNVHRISFLFVLILISIAILGYILDTSNMLYIPIRKLSEWAYLFMLVGALQLLILEKK